MNGFRLKYLVIIIILFTSIFSNSAFATSNKQFITTDIDNFAFKQEIKIPIDTSIENAKFQPIDVKITFNNPCYAIDETRHSVRVAYDDGRSLIEIESQIYNLEFSDNTHIKSCGLVFLIPEEVNGEEKFYVIYDSEEKNSFEMTDYLELYDSHYFYEPISGQVIDFDYYGIKQNNEVIYAIIQKGELLGNPIAQNVAKFKLGTPVVETNFIDQLSSFDMRYGIFDSPGYFGTAWAEKVTKEILVDGNLMVRVRLKCTSPNNDMKTDNIYTYYYSPTDYKKIYVNCFHEILKDINIEDPELYDGTYAGIVSIKSRSATIEKMNVGDILPQICLYRDNENIECYDVPQNPESEKKQAVLSTEADIDLGKRGWISLIEPDTGKAHGLIMEKTQGILSGTLDGVQAKAWVKQNIKYTGLEADTGSLFIFRNNYEKETGHNTKLEKGFQVNYNIEFFTTEKGGHEQVDEESEIFQNLVKLIPLERENKTIEEENIQRFTLKTYVHLAPAIPQGSLFSAYLGREIPYIYAEIYKQNELKSSGSVARISLEFTELDFEGKNLIEKLKTVIGILDWRNASLFKKIIFPDLEPGVYVVKIFRENPLFAKERQYIGFGIVDIFENTTIRIYCRAQGTISASIINQNNEPIPNVIYYLKIDDEIISDSVSDINGSAVLNAPIYPLKPYVMKVFYNGFLVQEKQITLGLKHRFIKLKETLELEQHRLEVKIKDKWGFAPAVETNPTLTSNEMKIPTSISGEKTSEGEYIFKDLLNADYTLSMRYKSFEIIEHVSLEKDKSIETIFPAEYKLDFNVMDSYGQKIGNKEIILSRNGKDEPKKVNEKEKTSFLIPPGEYELVVVLDEKEIAKQKIQIIGEREADIVTTEGSLLHNLVIIFGIILILISLVLILWKKQFYNGVKLIVVALILIAVFTSWWTLSGDDGATSTITNTYLIPSKIVSVSESTNVLGGEISQVPEEVTMVLGLLSILSALSCLMIIFSMLTKNKLRKTTYVFSFLSVSLLIVAIGIFVYAISQLTEISVGSFIGEGKIEITLPGGTESNLLMCNWGPGIGFNLGIIAVVTLIFNSVYHKIRKES